MNKVVLLFLFLISLNASAEWRYGNQKYGIDEKILMFAETTSATSLNLRFPYDGKNKATLNVVNFPDSGVEVYVHLTKGQISCNYSSCSFAVKFDDEPSKIFRFVEPSNHKNNIVHFADSDEIKKKLLQHKKMKIELRFFQDNNRVIEFNISNLNLQKIGVKKVSMPEINSLVKDVVIPNYEDKARQKILPLIIFNPSSVAGNPAVEVGIELTPNGAIINRKVLKSSGFAAWDRAVLTAIDDVQTLPKNDSGEAPQAIRLVFRPKD